jgi:hypothetical protein
MIEIAQPVKRGGGCYMMAIILASPQMKRQPDAKDKLRAAFAAANLPAKIEVYEGLPARLVRERRNGLQQGRSRARLWRRGSAVQEGGGLKPPRVLRVQWQGSSFY